jgi:hypothetical protein
MSDPSQHVDKSESPQFLRIPQASYPTSHPTHLRTGSTDSYLLSPYHLPISPPTSPPTDSTDLGTPTTPTITISYEGNPYPSTMPAPGTPALTAQPDGPQTPAAEAYDFTRDLPTDPNGSYTPGKTPLYPSGTPDVHRYTTHEPAFRHLSYPVEITAPPNSMLRKWTRRVGRRVKALPFVVKLGLVLVGTVFGIMVIRMAGTLRIPTHRGGVAWSDLQRRIGQGLGGKELCDPYVVPYPYRLVN